MNNLPLVIALSDSTLATSSQIIAQAVGYEHRAVLKLIKTYSKDLEAFGKIEFTEVQSHYGSAVGNLKNVSAPVWQKSDLPKENGRPTRIVVLNEQQATLLITFMSNNPKVRKFKSALIRAFYEMRTALQEQEKEKALAVAREERHEERALDNAGFEFHKQKEIVAREYARVHAETAEMLDWWNEKESELEKAAGNLRALAALMQDEMGKTARLLILMAGRKACTRAALSGGMKAMERREKQIAERENKALFHCFAFKD